MKSTVKNIVKRASVAALCISAAVGVNAQNLLSAYFDDNYIYRYQSNPAFGNEHNFVAMPVLGNMNVGINGTIGLNKLLYNVDGRTSLFLNPQVDTDSFVSGLKDKNRLGMTLNETLLAGGWNAWGGYNSITVGARADIGLFMPKDLFRLAKEGLANDSYNIGNTGLRAQAWVEIALGHSRQINSQWRVGMNMKFLLGAANMEAKFHQADLTLGQDNWTATVDAELMSSVKGMEYKTDFNDKTNRHYVSGAEVNNPGLNGFGMSWDFGAVYTLNPDWEFSAALLNVGFIHWNNNMLATTNGPQTVETDKYSFDINNDDTLDKFTDDLSMLYQLDNAGDMGGRTTGVGFTMNFAAQYTLPVYRNLKFGFLNNTRVQGAYSWTDFRLSANVEPVKWFSAGLNLGVGTFGCSFGWIANIHTKGFNIFFASDRTPGKLAKQGVPLNSNMNFNFGMNFPF